MPRYKLILEYDGAPFAGWQRQDALPTVQGRLETAVAALCGAAITVIAAGRTDAGVHALGQVAHLDLPKDYRAGVVRDALNAHLRPDPITVLAAEAVADDFNARFDATERRYLYRILDRRAPPALDRGRVWWIPIPLDAEAMHASARGLLGRHDFTTYRDAECQADSPVRTLDALDVVRVGEEVHVTARARSFLHRQVRSMSGALAAVGRGQLDIAGPARALAARDRAACPPVAPPEGLYLVGVGYGAETPAARRVSQS